MEQITCTKADKRGYVGKTVRASARSVVTRTADSKHGPTREEQGLLNCEVHTNFGELGIHKGYIADAGYDSEEGEAQIDVIYEDGDVRTVAIATALRQRALQPPGVNEDSASAFALKKMQLRPKQKGAWARNRKKRLHTIVAPQGIPMHIAAAEACSRGTHNRKTRAAVAHSKARRQQNITQQREAQEGNQRTAFSEPSVFAYREVSTGRRRQSERVAPGLGPGPAGGVKER